MGWIILIIAIGGVVLFMTTDARPATKATAGGLLALSLLCQWTPLGRLVPGIVPMLIQLALAIWMVLYFKIGDLRLR